MSMATHAPLLRPSSHALTTHRYNLDGEKDPPAHTLEPAANQFMAVTTLKHVLAYSVDDWVRGW